MARRLLFSGPMSSIFHGVNIAQRALDYQLERHNVLASNVANIDTPGFRPLDLVREIDSAESSHLRMQRTSAGHLTPPGEAPGGEVSSAYERVVQPGGDGNSVSLEREMAKAGANDLRYRAAGRIVRQQLSMLRYAAGDANR